VKLYNLGHVPWMTSQLSYHALAQLGWQGMFLVAPSSPYVCIGYHQDLDQDVDVDYCEAQNIPIFRREVGGGAVYLDGSQLFYQLILRPGDPGVPADKSALYRKFLEPVAATYRDLGVEAVYRPVNDVVTAAGRKISGTGVGEIGDSIVLVGNIILDFDYRAMARVLRVPDEKYRDKVYKTMRDNLSTLKEALGEIPSLEEIVAALKENFQKILGPFEETTSLEPELLAEMERLEPHFSSESWLRRGGRRLGGPQVKIATGVMVKQKVHKASGGLIRGTVALKGGKLASASFSGDFFFYPKEKLEELEGALTDVPLHEVEAVIESFYDREGVQSPGVSPLDLVQALPLEG